MKITSHDEEGDLDGKRRLRETIEEVGLSPDRLLALRNDKFVTGDVVLEEDDDVRLMPVISGG